MAGTIVIPEHILERNSELLRKVSIRIAKEKESKGA